MVDRIMWAIIRAICRPFGFLARIREETVNRLTCDSSGSSRLEVEAHVNTQRGQSLKHLLRGSSSDNAKRAPAHRFPKFRNVCVCWWVQPIDATLSANFPAGVWYNKVFLGRSLSCRTMALSWAWLKVDRSTPWGRYWRSKRLVFSLVSRCHGLCGSQK